MSPRNEQRPTFRS